MTVATSTLLFWTVGLPLLAMAARRSRRGRCVALAMLALAVPAAPALALEPDSDAPAGAPAHWLPNEDWVMERWLPYSEAQLMLVLDAEVEEVRSWLRTGDNLAAFARHKGLDPRRVLRRLMAPEWTNASPLGYRELRRRAWKTFTQRHLMQHMLFHTLHTRSFNSTLPAALGTSWSEFHRLRARRVSMIEIGVLNRRTPRQVLGALTRAVRRGAAVGVRAGATHRVQQESWLRAQLRALLQYTGWRTIRARGSRAEASAAVRPLRASATTASTAVLCALEG